MIVRTAQCRPVGGSRVCASWAEHFCSWWPRARNAWQRSAARTTDVDMRLPMSGRVRNWLFVCRLTRVVLR